MSEVLEKGEVTLFLGAWNGGDLDALSQVITLLYGDLRRMAASYFKQERSDHTLQPTALVNEVYAYLLKVKPVFNDRNHFLRCSCLMMRRLLVRHARARKALKRLEQTPIDYPASPDPDVLLDVHAALEQLQAMDARLGQIVEMRYFMGLSIDEIALYLSLSSRTVKREWNAAKTWLAHHFKSATCSV